MCVGLSRQDTGQVSSGGCYAARVGRENPMAAHMGGRRDLGAPSPETRSSLGSRLLAWVPRVPRLLKPPRSFSMKLKLLVITIMHFIKKIYIQKFKIVFVMEDFKYF